MKIRPIDWTTDHDLLRRGEQDYLVSVDPKFDDETAARVGAERVKALVKRDAIHGHVLETDAGEPAGYAVYQKRTLSAGEIVADLLAVWVAPEQRNRGCALMLMDHLFEAARRLGAHQVTTFVHPDNLASLSLYDKVGFVQTNRRVRRNQSDVCTGGAQCPRPRVVVHARPAEHSGPASGDKGNVHGELVQSSELRVERSGVGIRHSTFSAWRADDGVGSDCKPRLSTLNSELSTIQTPS